MSHRPRTEVGSTRPRGLAVVGGDVRAPARAHHLDPGALPAAAPALGRGARVAVPRGRPRAADRARRPDRAVLPLHRAQAARAEPHARRAAARGARTRGRPHRGSPSCRRCSRSRPRCNLQLRLDVILEIIVRRVVSTLRAQQASIMILRPRDRGARDARVLRPRVRVRARRAQEAPRRGHRRLGRDAPARRCCSAEKRLARRAGPPLQDQPPHHLRGVAAAGDRRARASACSTSTASTTPSRFERAPPRGAAGVRRAHRRGDRPRRDHGAPRHARARARGRQREAGRDRTA